jgi:hypothetical protein
MEEILNETIAKLTSRSESISDSIESKESNISDLK